MKYLVLMLLVTVSFAQQKQERYLIYTIETVSEEIPIVYAQLPSIGKPKQVPIMLDTWTGKTWMLETRLRQNGSDKLIEWVWVEVVNESTPK